MSRHSRPTSRCSSTLSPSLPIWVSSTSSSLSCDYVGSVRGSKGWVCSSANVVAGSNTRTAAKTQRPRSIRLNSEHQRPANAHPSDTRDVEEGENVSAEKRPVVAERTVSDAAHIKFAPEPPRDKEKKALYVAGPLEGQYGKFIGTVDSSSNAHAEAGPPNALLSDGEFPDPTSY
jgi:hypothetical protein